MKKIVVILMSMLVFALTGCGVQETMETVSDIWDAPVMAEIRQVEITLPKDAAASAMENGQNEKIYLCDGYTVCVQTLEGGDLNKTLQQTTGFGKEQLTVMQTASKGLTRYDFAWTAASETGEQVARAVLLDDGDFHYVVCVMADAHRAGELAKTWQSILDSVSLSTD